MTFIYNFVARLILNSDRCVAAAAAEENCARRAARISGGGESVGDGVRTVVRDTGA